MLYEQILNSADTFLRADVFDMALQRMVIYKNFKLVRKFKSGNRCRFFFTAEEPGLFIPVVVENVKPGVCTVKVEAGTIVEQYAIRFRLMRLAVLPDLLNTAVGSPGADLLPIASGVLVDFRNRAHTSNFDRLYMEQKEWEKFVFMNCFGRLHADGNVLGIVTGGDFHCEIHSEFNQDGLNSIGAEFIIRERPEDLLKVEELSLYFAECPQDQDYAGLAFAYKTFLKQRIDTLKVRMAENPVLEYSANALRVKIFCAVKEPFLPDGSAPVRAVTTFAEAELILNEMKAAGIEKAVVTLVGWNLGGHDGAYPTHFPVEPALGGEEGLKKLIAHALSLGYQIVPHDNITDIYRGSPDFDPDYSATHRGGLPVIAGIWGGGQSYKTCPRVYLERYGYEFDRIRNLGFQGHYYLDAQSSIMWSCHNPAHPADEREYALALSAITAIPRMTFGAISVEVASAYILPYIDETARLHTAITDPEMITRCAPNLGYLQPYAIPFYHIALHGILCYQDHWVHTYPDTELAQLQEIALGARPSMEISYHTDYGWGGDYKKSIVMIKEAYLTCYQDLRVQTEEITMFREPVPGFYEVKYENGVHLMVNTTNENHYDIPARTWKKI